MEILLGWTMKVDWAGRLQRPVTQLLPVFTRGWHGPHVLNAGRHGSCTDNNKERQLYNNISMLFLFPVKGGKLSTGVIAIFNVSCYG